MLEYDERERGGLRKELDEIIEAPVVSAIIQFLILASAVAFVLETESAFDKYETLFIYLDWTFLTLFSIEYIIRVYTASDRKGFIFSFFGIVDLLAILPALVLIPGFRVLRFSGSYGYSESLKPHDLFWQWIGMIEALGEVRRELLALVILCSLFVYLAACGIYVFEKDAQPEEFGSIPDAMWWAIVSLTTIGYGDVYPVTTGGKIFTALVALVGVGLIAIPSGLLASVLTEARVEEEMQDTENGEKDEK